MTEHDERYQRAQERVDAKKGFYAHALAFIVINVVFLIVAGTDWLWVTAFWGIGLVIQGWYVFLEGSSWVKGWEQRQIEREMAKDRPPDSTMP